MRFYLSRKKRPSEKVQVSIDFTNDLGQGDTVSGQAVTCYDQADPATDLTSTMIENATRTANVVLATVKNGVAGKSYLVKMVATSSAGFTYESDIAVDVRTDA
jgi:hypothetical protein